MKILLSGASGFVGSAVSRYFRQRGAEISSLSRKSSGWVADGGSLEGFDAVIHLAGEPIFGRWNREKMKRIYESRINGTVELSQLLMELSQPPSLFLSASAVGFYGDRGEEWLSEKSGRGSGFLADVCEGWERASQMLEERGVRRVQARFGIVVGNGGVLAKMRLPYLLGLGGRQGSGNQWVSWIALGDLVRAIDFAIQSSGVKGAVNFTSPNPVRQIEFARQVAALLHRFAWLPQPAWVLKMIFGQMADEALLASAKAAPHVLQEAGFTFEFPHLRDALQKALN